MNKSGYNIKRFWTSEEFNNSNRTYMHEIKCMK